MKCEACGGSREKEWCFNCGSSKSGCALLLSHGIHPEDIDSLLFSARNYKGIDFNTAQMIILAFSVRDDQPN